MISSCPGVCFLWFGSLALSRPFFELELFRPCMENIYRITGTCTSAASQGPDAKWFKSLVKYNGVCYNERSYNERMLQRTVFIDKIRMLQRTQRNTIGRRSTRVRMTCRAFPLWLERHSSSLLYVVRFSYQFSSVICLFTPSAVKIYIF
jgi:hypothetical protein